MVVLEDDSAKLKVKEQFYMDNFEFWLYTILQVLIGIAMGWFLAGDILWVAFIAFFLYLMFTKGVEDPTQRYKRLGVFCLKCVFIAVIGLVVNLVGVLFLGGTIFDRFGRGRR